MPGSLRGNMQPSGCTKYTQLFGCASGQRAEGAGMQVEREIVFPASPAEVWEALTEPERLEEWFATEVELDAIPGGEGVFRWGDGDERHAVVRELEEAERLVLDWDDGGSVAIELETAGDGTRVRVVETAPDFGL